MAMVTDPVCGMRIDPDDAAASAGHDGETYSFCSEACYDVFVVDPDPGGEQLTEEELASRSRTTRERVRELAELGVLERNGEMYPRRDVMRARTIGYLQTLGIAAEDMATALKSGDLTLGYLEAAGRLHPRSASTHLEVSAEIGVPFETLERIYVAFGLRRPGRDERVREEDLAIIRLLGVLIEAGVGGEEVLRMARVWGDNTRRIAQYLPHYFHTTVEERFRQRGLGDNAAYETAIREVGLRIGRSGEDLLGWLFRRHSEAFMTEHQVDHVETALEQAGVRPRAPRRPEAAVFADLSGYTELTEESGDEAAADVAVAFAQLVSELAAEHHGTTVKLLGDGVLLHFTDPADAIRGSLDLLDHAPASGLPPAHIGVNAGPILYDEGDYFGRTVNIASRIASHAGPGEVYVGESVVGTVREDGFTLRPLGEFELKGIADPIRLFQAVRAS